MSDYVPPPHIAVHWAIRRIDKEMPGRDPEWVAAEALRRMRAADRHQVLLHYVAADIQSNRRAEARSIEQRAYREATKSDRTWRKRHEAEKDRLRVEDPTEFRRRFPTIGEALDDLRTHLRLELTAELLNTSFSLGDGRSVTWGRATVADHRQRVSTLANAAIGTLQTAAMHEEAIALIEARGVTCLTEARMAGLVAA